MSKEFVSDDAIEAISLPKTNKKEFQLPKEAISHYIIVKYTPVATNGANGDPMYVVSDDVVERGSSQAKPK
ncbi:hypothetical protein Scep_006870 [Stephania cephalantha]|uniref:AIR9-like A9 domain-containing protein n=1 Tax=Stephania cephalantha TaxID=152367 RepID=A0AAP0KAH9_9MAGN